MPVIAVEVFAILLLINDLFLGRGPLIMVVDVVLLIICVLALVQSFLYALRQGLRALTEFYWSDFSQRKD